MLNDRRTDVVLVLLVIAVVAGVYVPLLLTGSRIAADNDVMLDTFRHAWLRKCLFDYGAFPLRSHFVGGGYPTIADPEDVTLNPLAWLLLPFSPEFALKLRYFLMAIAAAGGTYALARGPLRYSAWGAAFAALVFATATWIPWQVRGGNSNEIYPAIIPLALWCLLTAPRRPWRLVGAVALLYLIVSDGKQTMLVVVLFFLILGIVWWIQRGANPQSRGWRSRRLTLVYMALALAFTFLVGMMRILPTLSLFAQRGGLTDLHLEDHGHVVRYWTFGEVLRSTIGAHGALPNSEYFCVGLMPVLLLLISLAFARRRALPWCVVIIVFVWLALGDQAPINILAALNALPLYSSLDWPAKYLAPFIVLSISMAAGASISAVTRDATIRGAAIITAIAAAPTLWQLVPSDVWIATRCFTEPPADYVRGPAKNFYSVAGYDLSRDRDPTGKPHNANVYYNLARNVGTIDWYTTVPLPEHATPRYFVDSTGAETANADYRGEAYFQRNENKCDVVLEPNRIAVTVTMVAPDRVIINQNYDPGWYADTGVFENHNGLLAVHLDVRGHYTVTLHYRSQPFERSLAVTSLGIVLLLGFVLLRQRKRLDFLAEGDDEPIESRPTSPAAAFLVLGSAILTGALSATSVVQPIKVLDFVRDAGRLTDDGQFDAAQRELQRAIELDPRSPAAYLERGRLEFEQDHLPDAIAALTTAIRYKGDFARAFLARGMALAKQGDYVKAIEDYNRVLRLRPKMAEPYFLRGLAHFQLAEYVAAVADFKEASQRDRGRPTGLAADRNLQVLRQMGYE